MACLSFYSAEGTMPRLFQNASSVIAKLRGDLSGEREAGGSGWRPRSPGGSARDRAQACGGRCQHATPGSSPRLPGPGVRAPRHQRRRRTCTGETLPWHPRSCVRPSATGPLPGLGGSPHEGRGGFLVALHRVGSDQRPTDDTSVTVQQRAYLDLKMHPIICPHPQNVNTG